MHIKACLTTGYISRALRQVKMMFIPATEKSTILRQMHIAQTRDVHRNRNAPHDYVYTGSSGKQEVKLQIS